MANAVKMIVAIHGIGDQVGYSSVQSVAGRLASYHGVAAALPLGRFYPPEDPDGNMMGGPIVMEVPLDPEPLARFGFAEVYWADVARNVVKRGHILQETKSWVRTVTARIAVRTATNGPLPPREQDRIVSVLDEMIETIFVLERLSLVASKAGLFKFSLRSILVDFIGDVQLVADFAAYRSSILLRFGAMMEKARTIGGGDNELYLVAHSEGSILTFLALLKAIEEPHKYPWIESVKGLMTIGSPIETHHLLWPELWRSHIAEPRKFPKKSAAINIPWYNYYDHGDPVAYDLKETTAWLKSTEFSKHLMPTTYAYSRARVPGKAHVDYWNDDYIFGHFLQNVANVPPPAGEKPRFKAPPPNKRFAVTTSYLIPNALIWLLMLGATYALYRPVSGALTEGTLATTRVLRDVLGIGVLLLGATAAARLPRLTDGWKWWGWSAVLLGVAMFLYANLTCGLTREVIGAKLSGLHWLDAFSLTAGWSDRLPGCTATGAVAETNGVLGLTAFLTLFAAGAASWKPRWGVKILPITGAVAVLCVVTVILFGAEKVEMLPIVVGGALFLYLWWLASLLFDLVFVWQRYIRHSVASQRLAELTREGYKTTTLEDAVNHATAAMRSQ